MIKRGIITQSVSLLSVLWTLVFDDTDLQTGVGGTTNTITIPETTTLFFDSSSLIHAGIFSSVVYYLNADLGAEIWSSPASDDDTFSLSVNSGDVIRIQVNTFSGLLSGTVVIKENDTNGRILSSLTINVG